MCTRACLRLLQEVRCVWWGRFAHCCSWDASSQVSWSLRVQIYLYEPDLKEAEAGKEWFSTRHLPPQPDCMLFLRIKELSQWTWVDRCIRFLLRRYVWSGTPHHPNFVLEFWFHSKIEKVEISHMAPGPTYAQPVPYQNGTFVNTDKPTWIWSPRVHSLH